MLRHCRRMLEGKNNTFSLFWEIRSIFMQNSVSLFQPSNMAAVKTLYSAPSVWLPAIKPWPNGLASQRKSTQVFDLRSTCVSFGHPLASTWVDLGRLGSTCVDFGRAQICTQVDASFSSFGHPTQVDTS